MASPKDAVSREVPSAEVLADLRDRGPISAAIADVLADDRLDVVAKRNARYRIKAEASAFAAAAVAADPRSGPAGKIHIDVGRKDPATVSDVIVDRGSVVCTITHPDLPEFYPDGAPVNPFRFVNPPSMVPGQLVEGVSEITGDRRMIAVKVEDTQEAFRQMVRDAVLDALGKC